MEQLPISPALAEPFSRIFVDRAEADWAFDLLQETARRLDIHGAYDPRFALTLARRSGRLGLHLNCGGWLVLGFHGTASSAMHLEGASHLSLRVDLALLAHSVSWDERFTFLPFARKEGEPEVRSYHLPLDMVRPMTSELQAAYEATLAFIAQKFAAWKRASHWKQHNPEIAEALFKPEQRERVFAGLLNEAELRYERHLTAFYQDVSEEREEYEVGEEAESKAEAEGVADFGEINSESSLQRRSDVNLEISEPLSGTSYFTPKTFDLLAGLHTSPTKDFYLSHKDEFKIYVEEPFQQLFHQLASQLPPTITDLMETKKKVFARILKNDYDQGGAWDFYWGAFYPKGRKRTEDAQLSMWINYERLEFGFYIGEYGNNQRKRFVQNCQENYEVLLHLLKDVLTGESVVFGSHENIIIEPNGLIVSKLNLSWQEWLLNPDQGNFDVSVALPKQKVLQLSTEELTGQIVQTYRKLFPLVLLAFSDDPIPAITQYLKFSNEAKEFTAHAAPSASSFILHPSSLPYPLSQLAADTGFDEAELARWVRAIERKGQAILYGPPGTGKTFLAEKLAQHLVGGGDGFVELVQFHPAYAYEDFMQGIRPQSEGDRLSYPLMPGRFLEFCGEAQQRTGRCVLIVDEINRANLSRVFGELMYLLEYRDRAIPLAGRGDFHIPANVRLIGTMNTADRSIALVDHALRRRFAFIALAPNYDVLRRFHQATGFPVEGLIETLTKLNRQIGDPHYHVGITFFLHPHLSGELEDIWRMEIEPYLEEYFFDRPEQAENFRWDRVKESLGRD